jgi:hypothetical protein
LADCQCAERAHREATSFKLLAILALLIGASLIYAVAGGFSLDARKKYPLIPLLLLGCWMWRSVAQKRRAPDGAYLAFSAIVCLAAAMTTWLILGIWKYEVARYNALAETIAKNDVHGDIQVIWSPDLRRAWPQMVRSLGYGFDDTWVLNLAVEYRGGATISVAATKRATVLKYTPQGLRWVLVKR